ncbi:type II toxin-antitoxin system RelE/ParE family toxin [Tessaracoccus sp. MC1679]|uniref:type II toxin-antitoxin system RelE/ParE family toxin n=1 Tax=Tessaracoccus sp. MC1679 TaxID=2760313 RepID=UPI001602E1BE|nr:type II toxin-antitoxin system RelE/ParE family toxin [Tessaracoccus sp. MC1679]
MTYTVRFAQEAADQLEALYRYLASSASPMVAADYVDAIVAHCEGLAVFPHRGTMRDDIRPGLRTSSYKKRAVIATYVDDETQEITILGVFYGGQDYDTILSGSDNA